MWKLPSLHCLQAAGLLLPFLPNYDQSLLKSKIKTFKHITFSTKIPFWHQILVILMIYGLLLQNFVIKIYANLLILKNKLRKLFCFLDVCARKTRYQMNHGGLNVLLYEWYMYLTSKSKWVGETDYLCWKSCKRNLCWKSCCTKDICVGLFSI